jgi:hypothetical protein
MSKLDVRTYSVRFGDAFLLSIPDSEDGNDKTRHILIDVGNVMNKPGGLDDVFQPVVDDILGVLDGSPLDLYIMSHEHMDHTQGLHYYHTKYNQGGPLKDKLDIQYSWFTASSRSDYYDTHPAAKEAKLALDATYMAIESYVNFLTASGESVPTPLSAILYNNNPRSTKDNVDYLQSLSQNNFFIHRGFDPQGKHPFNEVQFDIWAPEEDTSIYYGRFRPMALGMSDGVAAESVSILPDLKPPPGVDAEAFYNLVNMRKGYADNLLAIDKAKNNTSVVLCLKWRGWKLLFSGDAEERSWKEMNKNGVLEPVHFLKVSHHGSHNGTPDEDLLDKFFPPGPQDGRTRTALVTTWEDTYNNVPEKETLDLFDPTLPAASRRCEEFHVLDHTKTPASYVDIEFPDEG